MKKPLTYTLTVTALAATTLSFAVDRITTAALKDVPNVQKMAQQANIVKAIEASNTKAASVHGKAIRALEAQWTQELAKGQGPLIDQVMKNPLAESLKTTFQNSKGKYLDGIVIDDKGFSLAQTYFTKHYSQKNHVVFKKTYKVGPKAVYISKSHFDKSIGKRVVTIAVPVVNAKAQPIGTFAVDVNFASLGIKESKW